MSRLGLVVILRGLAGFVIAAFVVESYLGIGGPTFFPDEYIQALRRRADQHGALLVFDEIQAGFGRTGRFFCYEHYGVEADLVCCGKGISSCLPLSAVLGPAALLDLPGEGEMTSTHSGNPLASAAALATLEVFERENLVAEAARKGAIFDRALRELRTRHPDHIGHTSGRGCATRSTSSGPAPPSLTSGWVVVSLSG